MLKLFYIDSIFYPVDAQTAIANVNYRESLAKYSDATLKLAKTLLGLISESLGVEAEAIEKACGEGQQKVLLNYYPTCPRPDLTLGLKRHTDPGTITILLQDKVGGLQATKDDGKTWVTVEPIDGAFVVNLGDQMHVSITIYLY